MPIKNKVAICDGVNSQAWHIYKKERVSPLLFGRYVTRTRDPHNVDVMRYQLRQSPVFHILPRT